MNQITRIAVVDGIPTTTTKDIADVYGKRHDNVIGIVRQRMAECPPEWRLLNFKEASIEMPQTNGGTVSYPVIRMTKKGFHFVVGKFTGAKAVQHQIAFADEFERMEQVLIGAQPVALPATISPAQRQHLHELVQLIVESGKQGHGETWKRFHNKFRVSKYEHLPASRFEEAAAYLRGKLDAETTVQLISKHLAERMPAAIEMALAAAGGVFTETIKAVLTHQHGPSVIRVLAAAQYVPGKGMVPTATALEQEAYAMPFAQMANVVSQSEGHRINEADLVSMISACSGQLATRHQQRLAA